MSTNAKRQRLSVFCFLFSKYLYEIDNRDAIIRFSPNWNENWFFDFWYFHSQNVCFLFQLVKLFLLLSSQSTSSSMLYAKSDDVRINFIHFWLLLNSASILIVSINKIQIFQSIFYHMQSERIFRFLNLWINNFNQSFLYAFIFYGASPRI